MSDIETLPADTASRYTIAADSDARAPKRKVQIRSFGCQMNAYDATRMGDLLEKEGYEETATQDDADLVILNTCHIREKASEKIF